MSDEIDVKVESITSRRHLSDALNEDLFPGNLDVFNRCKKLVGKQKVIVFSGAGVSAPLYPMWTKLLRLKIELCKSRGLIDNAAEVELLTDQAESDPLECASSLEDFFGLEQFRTLLAAEYKSRQACTITHDLLVQLRPKIHLTLNYDDGIELAYTQRFRSLPNIIRSSDRAETFNLLRASEDELNTTSILHWHGTPSAPKNMIFTGNDYNNFYSDAERIEFLSQLWRNQQLLVVGFGFTDPFLVRVAEGKMRLSESDNRHFAFIGRKGGTKVPPLIRKQFSNKYRIEPIFYQIRVDPQTGIEDHSDLPILLEALVTKEPDPSKDGGDDQHSSSLLKTQTQQSNSANAATLARKEFERHLFSASNGKSLFVEAELEKAENLAVSMKDDPHQVIRIDEIVNSEFSYVVFSRPEFGSSTLCRDIVARSLDKGLLAVHKFAEQLPAYKAKLLTEFKEIVRGNQKAVLVLDDFDTEQHERLLKELIGLGTFSRIIVICKARNIGPTPTRDMFKYSVDFQFLNLVNLHRNQIRSLAQDVFDSSDIDLISAIVDKVYRDLLDLCIPLTPSNVIMYLSIIHREGDFHPLNRVQIVERYIFEMLRRPSDAYADSFNAKNKIDVISAFVFHLHNLRRVELSDRDWVDFCVKYMNDTLLHFDELELLKELIRERIFIRIGRTLFFKYRFYYSYFLGRYVANRPNALAQFISCNDHIAIDGLVEVISATAVDNVVMLSSLAQQIELAQREFEDKYHLGNSDPFEQAEWSSRNDEEERFWRPIAEKLAAGPGDVSEIDKVKRSLLAEQRTADQAIIYQDFGQAERKMMAYHFALCDAISNTDIMDGALKKRCVKAVLRSYFIVYQIGLCIAPVIARRYSFFWNGMFYTARDYAKQENPDFERDSFRIAMSMSGAVARSASDIIGSKKLSEVYRVLIAVKEDTQFQNLIKYSLIIRSKPKNWGNFAEEMLLSMDRKSFYMRVVLEVTFNQFDQEVNTNAEREILKRLIATIRTKRDLNKDTPGSKVIGRVLARLEGMKYFEKRTVDDDEN